VDIGNDLPSQPDIPTPRIPDGPPAPQEPSLPQHAEVVRGSIYGTLAPRCARFAHPAQISAVCDPC